MTTTEQIEKLLATYPTDAKAWSSREPKPSGGFRKITKPNKSLGKWLQHTNNELFAIRPNWPSFMHGGLKKHSYVTHARPHVNKPCVITIDVRKCFDSITTQQVAGCFESELGISSKLAAELAERLCFKGAVAQGFATSNFVCNLYLRKPLLAIARTLKPQDLALTNYVDDIAVSGSIGDTGAVINVIALQLSKSGLAINKSRDKVKVMHSGQRQIVCGLLVNRKLTITRAKKLELFSLVARGAITEASLDGWLSNLHNVDPKFQRKLSAFATKKGLLKPASS
ncbi:MAG: putative RNA-directed polymerase [Candidatus Saccharibacteria bacterium]|nr:putative RNA-directed polymerase [Candidatus Saccharibacteria bacterium]